MCFSAQAQIADDEHVAIVKPHVGMGRGAEAVHDDGHAEDARQLPPGREMIGMSVGVDDVADMHPMPVGEPDIMIDLAQLRIDEHGGMCALAAHKIGLAPAGRDLLENHIAHSPSPGAESDRECGAWQAVPVRAG